MAIHYQETGDGCRVVYNDFTGKIYAQIKSKGKWKKSSMRELTYIGLAKRLFEGLSKVNYKIQHHGIDEKGS